MLSWEWVYNKKGAEKIIFIKTDIISSGYLLCFLFEIKRIKFDMANVYRIERQPQSVYVFNL